MKKVKKEINRRQKKRKMLMLNTGWRHHSSARCFIIILLSWLKFLLTRHSMAIQIGSDGFLQLVIGRRLLKPQAEVVLQVLVELVTWKQQAEKTQVNKPQHHKTCSCLHCLRAAIWPKVRLWKAMTFQLLKCSWVLKEHKSGLVYLLYLTATEVLQEIN